MGGVSLVWGLRKREGSPEGNDRERKEFWHQDNLGSGPHSAIPLLGDLG